MGVLPPTPMREMRALSSRRAILVISTAFSIAACDPGSSLGIDNQSDRRVVLRFTFNPDVPEYHPKPLAWAAQPRSSGVALDRSIGELPGTIEVLDENCEELGKWPSRLGGTVVVTETSEPKLTTPGPAAGASPELSRTTDCLTR